MKILVITPHYYPEQFRITQICESLVEKGLSIDVWTSIPNYPAGNFFDGYGIFKKRKEKLNGVNVNRMFVIPRKKNNFFRILNYITYIFSGNLKAKLTKENYDLIMVYQISPVTVIIPALTLSRKKNIPLITYVQDIWPESLQFANIKESNWIYKYFDKVSSKLYKNSNKLFVSSKSFKKHFINKLKYPKEKIIYVPDFSEKLFEENSNLKGKVTFDKNKTNLLFAGNIGKAQNLDKFMDLALIAKKKKEKMCFIFLGDGSEKERLIEFTKENKLEEYVEFLPRVPIEEVPSYYAAADILLISLVTNGIVGQTLPAKVQGYMAFGKPIFAVASGEIEEAIKEYKYGSTTNGSTNENYKVLLELISDIKSNKKLHNRKFYEENFKQDVIINRINKEIKNTVKDYRKEN